MWNEVKIKDILHVVEIFAFIMVLNNAVYKSVWRHLEDVSLIVSFEVPVGPLTTFGVL